MPAPSLRRAPLAAAALAFAALLGSSPASAPAAGPVSPDVLADAANQCESLTGAVINEWNQEIKPDIEQLFEGAQAAGRLVARGERASLGANAIRAATGQSPSQMAAQIMDDALGTIMGGVSGPWSEIGPQALDLPGTATGRIEPVVGTTRMFITPPNLTHNAARITVTKLDGRQRAEIVICKAPYDNPGNYTRVRVIEFDNGLANVGESQTVNIPDSRGYYFTVKVRKFVGTNSFEYRVRAETTGASALE